MDAIDNWKIAYNQLSQKIRDGRLTHKLYQHAWSKAEKECTPPGYYSNYSDIYKLTREYLKHNEKYQQMYKKYNVDSNQYWHYPCIAPWSEKAKMMLAELKEAKIEAQRQYIAEKSVVTS